MLFNPEHLLCLDFCAKLFFGRKEKLVFRGKELFAAMEHRIAGNVGIGIGTKDYAERRIIALRALALLDVFKSIRTKHFRR